MYLKLLWNLSTILVLLVILNSDQATGKATKTGYVEMQFTPYNKNRQSIGIGGYLNSSPRRPPRSKYRPRRPYKDHYQDYHDQQDYGYEDEPPYEPSDNDSSGSARCNCRTKYVAIEVPKGTKRKTKTKNRYRESNQQQYIAVPVETVSMNDNIERNAIKRT